MEVPIHIACTHPSRSSSSPASPLNGYFLVKAFQNIQASIGAVLLAAGHEQCFLLAFSDTELRRDQLHR